jgi:hypothetical protein
VITFSKIDGTPVYYWRSNPGNTTPRTWTCEQAFYDRLVVWIRDLRSQSAAYGSVSYLVSAGFYVNKPGEHGDGTAMDLDHVRWSDGTTSSPLDRAHASGTQAIRRRYFGDLPPRCVKGSSSDCKFVQAMCNNFIGSNLVVDGDWGSLTQSAFNTAKSRLGITGDPHTTSSVWMSMMWAVALKGFANQAF